MIDNGLTILILFTSMVQFFLFHVLKSIGMYYMAGNVVYDYQKNSF